MSAAEIIGCIWVLAGANGAGKSSVGGAMLRQSGGEYFNPDEVAAAMRRRDPTLTQLEANSLAWNIGLRQLDRAIAEHGSYFMETTLGGRTIALRLAQALGSGMAVRMWYVGLADPDAHIRRVAARVQAGGHDIPEDVVRRRFDSSRRNLIRLLPDLSELKLFDNTQAAALDRGEAPSPRPVLHWRDRRIIAPRALDHTPDWAKPIVAQALKHAAR